jgi:hypothetical protein
MASGGGDDVITTPQAQESPMGGRRRRHQTTPLPLDVIADIAARSDPCTLVRCAATCSDLRGRVADPGFRPRLRLRHAGRFVPSLLRGHLIGDRCCSSSKCQAAKDEEERVYLVDATAAGGATAVEVRSAAESFPPGPDGEPLALQGALSARDGLVLVRRGHELRVFNLATGRSQAVPPAGPGPDEFTGSSCNHVLLVGDGEGGALGRPYQVVVARLALEQKKHRRRLLVQTFSSELDTWGPCTDIRTPQIQGQIRQKDAHNNRGEGPRADNALGREPLVAGGAVHWLCLTDSAGYILKLRVCRTAAAAAAAPRLTVSKLPERFPHNDGGHAKHLLVTMEAGGIPAVLVADGEKVSAWTHQPKHTASWSRQPEVVIEYETISRLLDSVSDVRMREREREHVKLEWFAERSGIVLVLARDYHFLWLDLRSKKIVRWSADPRIRYKTMYHPCEMDLSTWAPTFSSSTKLVNPS